MTRDILCDSDCVYKEKGVCEKQNDISMSRKNEEGVMIVSCDDYIPKRENE